MKTLERTQSTCRRVTAPARLPAPRDILFVDDDEDWRLMIAESLMEAGYTVRTAANCAEATSLTAESLPTLILLDINLGHEDGLDLLQVFRNKHPALPVILYSGMDHSENEIQSMLAQGADRYLHKGAVKGLLDALAIALK